MHASLPLRDNINFREEKGAAMTGFTYRLVDSREEARAMLQLCRGSFRAYYPKFDSWYLSKVVPGIGLTREILIASTEECRLAGICILKSDGRESKICSLRVDARHRGQGVASSLIRRSMDLLEDDKPLITVPAEIVPELSPLLARANFELSCVYRSIYRAGIEEYSYNGLIVPSGVVEARSEQSLALSMR